MPLVVTIPDFAAGVITLTLNASAYIAEIVRGGSMRCQKVRWKPLVVWDDLHSDNAENHFTASDQNHDSIFR